VYRRKAGETGARTAELHAGRGERRAARAGNRCGLLCRRGKKGPSMRRDAKYLAPSAPYKSGLDRRARRGARGGPADRARLVLLRGAQGASGCGHWKTWCVGKARGWARTPRRGRPARDVTARRRPEIVLLRPCLNTRSSKNLNKSAQGNE
jgi:hypothetical protein